MASLEDIAAMKLNAIIRSGSRVKDFVDVAYLSSQLHHYSHSFAVLKKAYL